MKKILLVFALSATIATAYSQPKKSLTLGDFVPKSTFVENSINSIKSMNDGISFTSLVNEKKIVRYNYKTGQEIETIFDADKDSEGKISKISGYVFSDDERRILIETDVKNIYRRSYTAVYYVWECERKNLTTLSDEGRQQVPSFSPDGERVAFARNNNLYIKTLKFGTEYAVTNDGKRNEIINGTPDWVYEEEFVYNKAYQWSPDSKMLAYVKFDESKVPEYSFPMYKGSNPEMTENQLYPGEYRYKYPKAGETNSTVTAYVHDVKTRSSIRVKIDDQEDYYIPRIKWTPSGSDLVVFKINRKQNDVSVLYANPFTGDTRRILQNKNNRYIDEAYFNNFTFLNDNQHFVTISEADGWAHLYLYKNTGIKVKQLTTGNFDVTSFYGYDPVKKIFYYQAAKKTPLQREVYALSLDGKKDICISQQTGTSTATFNTTFNYFIGTFSDSKTPLVYTVNDATGKVIRTLEDNSKLKSLLAEYQLPTHEFFKFTTGGGIELNGYMLKPSNFDPAKKYPVVMTQYSGPNSQEVIDKWSIDWHSFLAEQGYIVACVDPRGTAARGEEFRKCTYMQIGVLETIDQIEAAKYLAKQPYINADKIGIWGWSYGGFMAVKCIEKGNDVFNTAVAVAPVTDWRFYDAIYAERYMRTPQQNPDGYDESSVFSSAADIKGNLLLIHGTADDNVHTQNSFEFAEALTQNLVQFDMMTYTNRNHGIQGGNTRIHLYTKIFNYFESHLK